MKQFLATLLPKNPIFDYKANQELDAALKIIERNVANPCIEQMEKVKNAFLDKSIDKSLFPFFEQEYGLPSFFKYNDASDKEKESIIKAKIFISTNGIKTLEDYKFLASIFLIRDINVQTYVQYIGPRGLDLKFDGLMFGNNLNAHFLVVVSLPIELKEIEDMNKFDFNLDFQLPVSSLTNLDNFKTLIRQIIPITHGLKFVYTL